MFGAAALWLGMLAVLRNLSQDERADDAFRTWREISLIRVFIICCTPLIAVSTVLLFSTGDDEVVFLGVATAYGIMAAACILWCLVTLRRTAVRPKRSVVLLRLHPAPAVKIILGVLIVFLLLGFLLGPYPFAVLLALGMAIALRWSGFPIWRKGARRLSALAAASFTAGAAGMIAVVAVDIYGDLEESSIGFLVPFLLPLGFLLLPLLLRASASYRAATLARQQGAFGGGSTMRNDA